MLDLPWSITNKFSIGWQHCKPQCGFFNVIAFIALIPKKVSLILKSDCNHGVTNIRNFQWTEKPWLDKTITEFPFDINTEDFPGREKNSLVPSLSLTPSLSIFFSSHMFVPDESAHRHYYTMSLEVRSIDFESHWRTNGEI